MAKDEINVVWVHAWLKTLMDGPMKQVTYAVNLVPPEVWANYTLMGLTGLAEQRILQDAKQALTDEWLKTNPWLKKEEKDVQPQRTENIPSRVSSDGVVSDLQTSKRSDTAGLLSTPG